MTTSKEASESRKIKLAVVEQYSGVAKRAASCCGPSDFPESRAAKNYAEGALSELPENSVAAAAGCGNPVALASLKKGETVLDLGSGGGADAFLAAKAVGPEGRVIGIDMTMDMIMLARESAAKLGQENVEFRLAEIEALPVESGSVDVIISNCVINLSTDKDAVFREAMRVLRPGGRVMVSDIVLVGDLPQEVADDPESWAACVSGALPKDEYLSKIESAGFNGIEVEGGTPRPDAEGWRQAIATINVRATKPGAGGCCA